MEGGLLVCRTRHYEDRPSVDSSVPIAELTIAKLTLISSTSFQITSPKYSCQQAGTLRVHPCKEEASRASCDAGRASRLRTHS